MKYSILLLILSILILSLVNTNKLCIKYQNNICVQCSQQSRMHQNYCYIFIPHCRVYEDGTDCLVCQQGYKLINDGSNKKNHKCKLDVECSKTQTYYQLIKINQKVQVGHQMIKIGNQVIQKYDLTDVQFLDIYELNNESIKLIYNVSIGYFTIIFEYKSYPQQYLLMQNLSIIVPERNNNSWQIFDIRSNQNYNQIIENISEYYSVSCQIRILEAFRTVNSLPQNEYFKLYILLYSTKQIISYQIFKTYDQLTKPGTYVENKDKAIDALQQIKQCNPLPNCTNAQNLLVSYKQLKQNTTLNKIQVYITTVYSQNTKDKQFIYIRRINNSDIQQKQNPNKIQMFEVVYADISKLIGFKAILTVDNTNSEMDVTQINQNISISKQLISISRKVYKIIYANLLNKYQYVKQQFQQELEMFINIRNSTPFDLNHLQIIYNHSAVNMTQKSGISYFAKRFYLPTVQVFQKPQQIKKLDENWLEYSLKNYTGFNNISNITIIDTINYANLYSTYTVKFNKFNNKTNANQKWVFIFQIQNSDISLVPSLDDQTKANQLQDIISQNINHNSEKSISAKQTLNLQRIITNNIKNTVRQQIKSSQQNVTINPLEFYSQQFIQSQSLQQPKLPTLQINKTISSLFGEQATVVSQKILKNNNLMITIEHKKHGIMSIYINQSDKQLLKVKYQNLGFHRYCTNVLDVSNLLDEQGKFLQKQAISTISKIRHLSSYNIKFWKHKKFNDNLQQLQLVYESNLYTFLIQRSRIDQFLFLVSEFGIFYTQFTMFKKSYKLFFNKQKLNSKKISIHNTIVFEFITICCPFNSETLSDNDF